MGFFKQKANIVFLFVIFLLTAALAVTSFFVYEKHTKYISVSASLSDNSKELESTQAIIDELNDEIKEYASKEEKSAKEKEKLNSQLKDALKEKEKLEKENKKLKNQLKDLTEKKRRNELQYQITLRNINQADAATSGICYLTFDDGPSDNTLKILDILDDYGIKGTFFVIGNAKTAYLPQIYKGGHTIGLHSATHDYSSIYKNTKRYLKDINSISDTVYKKVGIRSKIMRFPGGSSNLVSAKYCKGIMSKLTVKMPELGYSYFDWNVDSGDAEGDNIPASKIVKNVLSGAEGKKSICVLFHDTAAKDTTVKALPDIIEGLDAMGFRFAALKTSDYGFHQPVKN